MCVCVCSVSMCCVSIIVSPACLLYTLQRISLTIVEATFGPQPPPPPTLPPSTPPPPPKVNAFLRSSNIPVLLPQQPPPLPDYPNHSVQRGVLLKSPMINFSLVSYFVILTVI